MRYGLLSGKYDSTKQRAVLLNGNRLCNYQRYNATLRMEMLLTGGIVVTDAQFFDGLYFHWMTKHGKDYQEFKEFVEQKIPEETKKIFDVKVRCDAGAQEPEKVSTKDEAAKQIFGKEFYHSSIEMKELLEYVYELSKDYSEKLEGIENGSVREFPNTLSEYITNTRKDLEDLYGSYIAEMWEEYSKGLEQLFEFKFGRWGFKDIKTGEWKKPYNIKDFLAQHLYLDNNITYREKMKKLLEEAKADLNNVSADKYFARIESKLNQDLGLRSNIVFSLDKIELIINNTTLGEEGKKKIKRKLREFKCIMNDRYNKAFAYQHGCKFVDMCDYQAPIKYLSKNNSSNEKVCVVEKEAIEILSKISWEEFGMVLQEIKPEMENWLKVYDSYLSDGNESEINNGIDHYIKRITECIKKKCQVNDNGFDVGPWNYKNTNDNDIFADYLKEELEEYPFVGGGSFEEGNYGNEICMMCPNPDKIIILRIRTDFDVENDKEYDTMIAPVENLLNGGSLKTDNKDAVAGK